MQNPQTDLKEAIEFIDSAGMRAKYPYATKVSSKHLKKQRRKMLIWRIAVVLLFFIGFWVAAPFVSLHRWYKSFRTPVTMGEKDWLWLFPPCWIYICYKTFFNKIDREKNPFWKILKQGERKGYTDTPERVALRAKFDHLYTTSSDHNYSDMEKEL